MRSNAGSDKNQFQVQSGLLSLPKGNPLTPGWIKIRADEKIDGGEQDHRVIFMIGDHFGKVSISRQMTGCIYCIF